MKQQLQTRKKFPQISSQRPSLTCTPWHLFKHDAPNDCRESRRENPCFCNSCFCASDSECNGNSDNLRTEVEMGLALSSKTAPKVPENAIHPTTQKTDHSEILRFLVCIWRRLTRKKAHPKTQHTRKRRFSEVQWNFNLAFSGALCSPLIHSTAHWAQGDFWPAPN